MKTWGEQLLDLCIKYNWDDEILYKFIFKQISQVRKQEREDILKELSEII